MQSEHKPHIRQDEELLRGAINAAMIGKPGQYLAHAALDSLFEQLETARALVEMARDPDRWDEFLAAAADYAGEVPSLPYGGSSPAKSPNS